MNNSSLFSIAPVGASLLAKTIDQSLEMYRMCWRLRERARSHEVDLKVI